jgi:hypothetical protein
VRALVRSGQSTETVRRRGAEAGRDCKCNEDEHRNLSEYIRVVLFLFFFFFVFFFWGFGDGEGLYFGTNIIPLVHGKKRN